MRALQTLLLAQMQKMSQLQKELQLRTLIEESGCLFVLFVYLYYNNTISNDEEDVTPPTQHRYHTQCCATQRNGWLKRRENYKQCNCGIQPQSTQITTRDTETRENGGETIWQNKAFFYVNYLEI